MPVLGFAGAGSSSAESRQAGIEERIEERIAECKLEHKEVEKAEGLEESRMEEEFHISRRTAQDFQWFHIFRRTAQDR